MLSLLVFLSAREQLNKLTIAEKEATEGKETKKAIQETGQDSLEKQNKTKTKIFILLNYPGENMSELHPKIELLRGRKFVKPRPVTLQLHVEQSRF